MDDYQPVPGTIGLSRLPGAAGLTVHIGQWLVTKLDHVRLRTGDEAWADWQHAFVYLGDGVVMSAEPGGARIRPTTRWDPIYWCKGIASQYMTDQLRQVSYEARTFQNVPYSFLDYAAIAAHTLHLPIPGLKDLVARSGHMICSQLCDSAYDRAGLHLFQDRWPGYVDPLDLYILDQELQGKAVPRRV